jgi:integrating conjugative element protein (TIGR03757 family)
MKHFSLGLGLVAVVACCVGPAAAQPVSTPLPQPRKVEVFANSAMHIANPGTAAIYRLDALALLEEELSAGLPADEALAMPIAQERMRRMESVIRTRAGNAAQGLEAALQYGIERIPAIVIDGQDVVYGITDVGRALHLWRAAQGKPTAAPALPPAPTPPNRPTPQTR